MKLPETRYLLALVLAAAACGDDGKDAPADAAADAAAPDAPAAAAVTLSTAGGLGAHLVDKDGKTLYFFANDTPGANASTNTNPVWTAFDVQAPTVGAGLTASDFGRFDRGGGAGFQATWKGRPLYYFANDTAAAPTAGEGTGGRWFVARAYNLFFAANATVTPQGGAANAPFLTNGAGRSLYITSQDTRGVGATAPVSYCTTGGCVTTWPLWEKPGTLTDVVLPSTIPATDVTAFTSLGKQQFVYKGWPLYFFGTDTNPGQVEGSTKPTWFAVNAAWNGTITP